MRKNYNKYIWLLIASIAAFSCNNVEEEIVQEQPQKAKAATTRVHFNASLPETKAQFGQKDGDTYPTLWTSNDSEVKISLNYGTAVQADVTPSQDFRTATFDADISFTGVEGPYRFYSVSPASAAYALSPSREAWKVSIPCEQTPTSGSVDEAGIILASSSAEFQSEKSVQNVDLTFHHLTAYGRFSLTDIPDFEGKTVSAIELTFTTPVVGDWYWNTSGSTITDYGASSTIKLNTSSVTDVWFACAPVDVSEEMLVIRVITDAGTYEHFVEFPANRKFTAGQTAVFTVNMAAAEFSGGDTPSGDFTLVTDVSTLQVGDEIIIANYDGTYGLGDQNSSYRLAKAIETTGNIITNTGEANIITLGEGTVEGTWSMKIGNQYLASTNTENNAITSTSTLSEFASWTIEISNEEASIMANGGTRNRLRYNYNNGNTPRFNCYGSKTNVPMPVIYRRGIGTGPATEDPMLSNSEYGCYLGTGNIRTLFSGNDQVTRSYSSDNVLTYTIINPTSIEELEITGYKKSYVKGDACQITVNWRQNGSTYLSGNYTMHVIKEEGPKVWLGDGSGKGFIIKK